MVNVMTWICIGTSILSSAFLITAFVIGWDEIKNGNIHD